MTMTMMGEDRVFIIDKALMAKAFKYVVVSFTSARSRDFFSTPFSSVLSQALMKGGFFGLDGLVALDGEVR